MCAVDRDELARVLDEHRLIINYGQSICRCGQRLVKSPNDSASHVWQAHHAHLAVVIAGVLVDAADVRARVADLEAGIRRETRHLSGDLLCGPECVADHLRALVGDETPKTFRPSVGGDRKARDS